MSGVGAPRLGHRHVTRFDLQFPVRQPRLLLPGAGRVVGFVRLLSVGAPVARGCRGQGLIVAFETQFAGSAGWNTASGDPASLRHDGLAFIFAVVGYQPGCSGRAVQDERSGVVDTTV